MFRAKFTQAFFSWSTVDPWSDPPGVSEDFQCNGCGVNAYRQRTRPSAPGVWIIGACLYKCHVRASIIPRCFAETQREGSSPRFQRSCLPDAARCCSCTPSRQHWPSTHWQPKPSSDSATLVLSVHTPEQRKQWPWLRRECADVLSGRRCKDDRKPNGGGALGRQPPWQRWGEL